MNTENDQKVFMCHAYQCGFRGNLLTLMHGSLTGTRPFRDKLTGDEFRFAEYMLGATRSRPNEFPSLMRERNTPFVDSAYDEIRILATLDDKFIIDVATMPPPAASYVRRHPCLSPESMKKWRVGVLPMDGGSDKRGLSMRGYIIYPIISDDGHVVAWICRDPKYEEKERDFSRLTPVEPIEGTAPWKYHFPPGFHRGLELFGQQASRLQEPGYREAIARHGLIVVEGFNDVIGLDNLGVPAVAIMSNRVTESQIKKITRWSQQLASGKVTLLFDCEPTGDDGAKEAAWHFTQRGLNVRLGWTQATHGGAFQGRQPENLTREEWQTVIHPAIER